MTTRTKTGRLQHLARARDLTRHSGELLNQLINHAMVQHCADSVALQEIDLVLLVRKQMSDMLSQHAQRVRDVGLAAPDSGCLVKGGPITLREAFKNVLGKALRYGAFTLFACRRGAPEHRLKAAGDRRRAWYRKGRLERVRKPFSARGDNRLGASLGLSIVDEVVHAQNARMRFGHDYAGHFVQLALPAAGQR